MTKPSVFARSQSTVLGPATGFAQRYFSLLTVTAISADGDISLSTAKAGSEALQNNRGASRPAPDSASLERVVSRTALSKTNASRRRTKMSIYPNEISFKELQMMRITHNLGASIVAEYALEIFLETHTDQEIVTMLRSYGHGLRRKRKMDET